MKNKHKTHKTMETNFQIGQKVAVDVSYGEKHEGFITKLDSGHPLYDRSKVKVSGIGDPVKIGRAHV